MTKVSTTPSSSLPSDRIADLCGGPLDGATAPISDPSNPPKHWRFRRGDDNLIYVYMLRVGTRQGERLVYDFSGLDNIAPPPEG